MDRIHPVEFCRCVVDVVGEDRHHRSAAAPFRVSIRFVNDMVKLQQETGSLAPRPQGHGDRHGKLAAVRGWLKTRMTEKRDLRLNDLVAELGEHHGIAAQRASVWRALRAVLA